LNNQDEKVFAILISIMRFKEEQQYSHIQDVRFTLNKAGQIGYLLMGCVWRRIKRVRIGGMAMVKMVT